MPLPWSKKSIIDATDGSSTFSHLFGGKSKRIHTEVQVIPYPRPPSSSASGVSQDVGTGQQPPFETIHQYEDVNDWEVEIVPVPPKPVSFRTISLSKRRSSPEMMYSREKRTMTVEVQDSSVASKAPVPTTHDKSAAVPAPNHFFKCAVIADGILTEATETVLDMIVNTITVADTVCTCRP